MPTVVVASPLQKFAIRFEPDFALRGDDGITAYHLWNTKTPPLQGRFVEAALAIALREYKQEIVDKLAVLSLLDLNEFNCDRSDELRKRALSLIGSVEAVFGHVEKEISDDDVSRDRPQRPSLPPPAVA